MINNRRKQPKRKFHLKCRLRGKNFKNHILITRGLWGEVCLLLEMIGSWILVTIWNGIKLMANEIIEN